jgi:cholesterol transport system auxiliary component
MFRHWLLILLPLLAACAGNGGRGPDAARFDLGPAGARGQPLPGIAVVSVTAPSWLAGTAMQYRLAYADAARRQDYGASRWAAPPAELLQKGLERGAVAAHGCRLQLELDEFVQVFDGPEQSRLVLDLRASLLFGHEVVARRPFALAPAAPSADARGGVAAAATAVDELARGLARWLEEAGAACRET